MKIILAWYVILSQISLGCAVSGGLRSDEKPSAIESSFYSAGIQVDDRIYLGVASEKVSPGKKFAFSVLTFGYGFVKVASQECGFDQSKTYANSESVEFTLSQEQSRCLYQIYVFPQFSSEESKGVEWRGLQGVLILRRTDLQAILKAYQYSETKLVSLSLPIESADLLTLNGCGVVIEKELKQKFIDIPSVEPSFLNSVCVLDGFFKRKNETTVISILVTRFNHKFSNLPFPSLRFTNNQINVSADPSVSFITFVNEFAFSHSHSFLLKDGILKGYSVKGRAFYCKIFKSGDYRCVY